MSARQTQGVQRTWSGRENRNQQQPGEEHHPPFVVGRKVWLFSDTPDGAECSAVIYSLMETNKANGLRLEDYILHLLFVLPERFKADPDADIDDLLPWSDGMKDNFAML